MKRHLSISGLIALTSMSLLAPNVTADNADPSAQSAAIDTPSSPSSSTATDQQSKSIPASLGTGNTNSASKVRPFEEGDDEPTMNLEQARAYMLSLINADRAKQKVANPVALDNAANKAAQWHATEMARLQTNSHWHIDGKKPPQRYNESGGTDYVGENSHGCVPTAFKMNISNTQMFSKEEVRNEESCYFDEEPPNDGHRKNILDPNHTHVGIGLALVDLHDRWGIVRVVVSAQEFINKYGNFTVSSNKLVHGQKLTLAGELNPGYKIHSLNVAREDSAHAIPLKDLQDYAAKKYHGSYSIASERVTICWPNRNDSTEAHVTQTGQHVEYSVTPATSWKKGLYYMYLWATKEGTDLKLPISLVTARLD